MDYKISPFGNTWRGVSKKLQTQEGKKNIGFQENVPINVVHSSPAISVVVPTFNAEPWLLTLLDCLDRQTFRDFEVIFVNDGSTDHTGAMLDAYAASRNWVNVLHQQKRGAGGARNTGINVAKGEYVVFIDADDAASESHLDDLYSLARALDLDVAMCNGWRFHKIPGDSSEKTLVTRIRPEKKVMTGIEWFEWTFNEEEWWGHPWMTMIRLDFLRQHSISFMEGVAFEDNLWNVMVQSRARHVAYTSKPSYYYRWTPGSVLNDQSISKKLWRIDSYIQIIEHLWRLADSEMPQTATLFKRLAAYEGRILLARLAELDSLKTRMSISLDLKRKGFLARMFREVEQGMHRKRILRAYGFACLGILVESLKIGRLEKINIR